MGLYFVQSTKETRRDLKRLVIAGWGLDGRLSLKNFSNVPPLDLMIFRSLQNNLNQLNRIGSPRRRDESHAVLPSSPQSLPPFSCLSRSSFLAKLDLLIKQLAPGHPLFGPGCFSRCGPVYASKPWSSRRSAVVLSVQLSNLLTGTSREVQVQAMGCPSAALWPGQLHGIPLKLTGQADVGELENASPFSHHFSLLKMTSAGC